MVEQFGFAMIPAFPPSFKCAMASGFTSGITNGTPSAMRNALELSTTKHPFSTATGPNFFEIDPPAENNAMSCPSNELSVSSSTTYVSPSNSTFDPALRALASIFISLYGKSLSLSTRRNSCPTAPVMPAMTTFGPLRRSLRLDAHRASASIASRAPRSIRFVVACSASRVRDPRVARSSSSAPSSSSRVVVARASALVARASARVGVRDRATRRALGFPKFAL